MLTYATDGTTSSELRNAQPADTTDQKIYRDLSGTFLIIRIWWGHRWKSGFRPVAFHVHQFWFQMPITFCLSRSSVLNQDTHHCRNACTSVSKSDTHHFLLARLASFWSSWFSKYRSSSLFGYKTGCLITIAGFWSLQALRKVILQDNPLMGSQNYFAIQAIMEMIIKPFGNAIRNICCIVFGKKVCKRRLQDQVPCLTTLFCVRASIFAPSI